MPDDVPTTQESRIHCWLKTAPTRWFVAYAALAAFATYFCMYAFRKPFAAAKYEGLMFLGTDVNLKTVLLISQIIGYALSKYAGNQGLHRDPAGAPRQVSRGADSCLLSLRCSFLA